jgi:hypothetical protein
MGSMSEREPERLPAGRPPWDTWNGARVGLLGGGLIGILVVAVSGSNAYWSALIVAAAGGLLGYWTERRKRRGPG